MDSSDESLQLLKQIRDLQDQHLQEYKKASARALETQELALKRQAAHLALYKRVLLVGGIVVLGLLVFMVVLFYSYL